MDASTIRVVLIVDDEPLMVRSLERVLSRQYVVRTAVDGREALALLDTERGVGLLIADWVMPYGGVDLVTRVCREHPDVAIIVTTGLSKLEAEPFLRGIGCAVLYKPFGIDDLVAAIELAASYRT